MTISILLISLLCWNLKFPEVALRSYSSAPSGGVLAIIRDCFPLMEYDIAYPDPENCCFF